VFEVLRERAWDRYNNELAKWYIQKGVDLIVVRNTSNGAGRYG
jgi:hypothetical protein